MRSLSLSPLLVVVVMLFPTCAPAQSQENWTSKRFIGETLRVDVDVVDVYFTVKRHNHLVENLTKDDFDLRENNEKQRILYFSSESQAPLSLGVLIDTSGSESPMLHTERAVAKRFFDTVLVAGDEGLVASFDSHVDLKQDFTGDHALLVKGIEASEQDSSRRTPAIDSGPVPKLRSTALYDAIVGIAEHRFANRRDRNAMIIITDGQDQGSRATAQQAVEAALKSNSICYVLLVGDKAYMSSPRYKGGLWMGYLASETGGSVIVLDKKLKGLERTLLQIADELRHHYSIGYTPVNRTADGRYRKISIRAPRGYKIQSRRGYYYMPHDSQDAETSLLRSSNE
ncbi:MAG: VWA domain-containing protein [Terriglobia bacterium]|nr:VWA domain-containing protein [Terriglobia bacterium]